MSGDGEELGPDEELDLPPEECECEGQGWCRVCREWAAQHDYEDWS